MHPKDDEVLHWSLLLQAAPTATLAAMHCGRALSNMEQMRPELHHLLLDAQALKGATDAEHSAV
jgi:hypothetical protein